MSHSTATASASTALVAPPRREEPTRRAVCVRANPWDAGCPSRQVLDLVANKWVLLILPLLRERPHRNAELLRGVEGISQKVLTQTLRALEPHGLVSRRDFGVSPPRVEYRLTALGLSLADTMAQLDDWVVEHFADIRAARERYERPPTPSPMRSL
ncbi:MAG: helix-turn-helix transcriptional regulator [Gemmatimonadaceae bacterium]|nr:helix-turn-helix transcriptional regulator [Gemmatimonadaceae bacterium]